ncbi:hypothetical protein CKAH01_00387 [Colletotrichum kahawae]|uniref:Uncharacterized protein n=1 Tax=Colletotrichum kahawae TaxID=34407 RepID=A0AAD9YYB7_COLKA|nr:hypothetical protein CKAH01_00387 [Colletotrichum kahawae]
MEKAQMVTRGPTSDSSGSGGCDENARVLGTGQSFILVIEGLKGLGGFIVEKSLRRRTSLTISTGSGLPDATLLEAGSPVTYQSLHYVSNSFPGLCSLTES